MATRRRTTASGATSRSRDGQAARSSGARAPRKKTVKLGPVPFIIAFVAIVAVIGIATYSSMAPYYTDTITKGVMINGIDVSGMTGEEAFAVLSSYANERIGNISVTIRYQDRTWNYGASELNATLDFTEVVNSAKAVARTGKIAQRKAEAQAALSGQHQFDTSMAINLDNLEYYLNRIKQELDVPAVDASMTMQCDGPTYTVQGYNYYQPGVDYSSLFVTTPGSNGIEVDVPMTMELLRQDLADDYNANIELVVNTISPVHTEQSLRDSAVLLFHSTSKLRNSTDNRNTNIQKALANFDGMVIAPDQVVSFNETVGERTEARGYLEANQIGQDGSLEPGLGGGICQAATVLFNAAINAGCEVIERKPHKWPMYYLDYDWGLDAMVNWGTSDMVFKNTTGSYLYIDFYFDYSYNRPAYIDIDIYGMPFEPGVTVKMESQKVSEEPAPAPQFQFKSAEELKKLTIDGEWKYDATLNLMTYEKVTSRPGYVFNVTRVWYKDGVEFNREPLYTTTYKPVQGITYTKAVDVPVVPEPTPTPAP